MKLKGMTLMKPLIRLYPELPIKGLEEDALDLGEIVNNLTSILANAGSPLMLGLYGSWGSGKSSIINSVKQFVAFGAFFPSRVQYRNGVAGLSTNRGCC